MPDTQISEEMVERAAAAIRELTGPYLGTPEQIAKHGERIRLRQEESARKFARAALVAALSGHVVGWRTMDSAPKSKNILLFAVTDIAEDGEVKNWKMHSGGFHTGYGAWEWAGRILQPYDVQPTHWQPLPAPPVQKMEG